MSPSIVGFLKPLTVEERLAKEKAIYDAREKERRLVEARSISEMIARRTRQHFSAERMAQLIAAIRAEKGHVYSDQDVYREVVSNLEFVEVNGPLMDLSQIPDYIQPDLPAPQLPVSIFPVDSYEDWQAKLEEKCRLLNEKVDKIWPTRTTETYRTADGQEITIVAQPIDEALMPPQIPDPKIMFDLSQYTDLHFDPNQQIDPMYLDL